MIDSSRGTRNAAELSSTPSIAATATSPVDGVEPDDGLLHYAHRTGDLFVGYGVVGSTSRARIQG